ncbi:MAG: hypothetical protein ACRDRQ_05630 [Pseudonocardiaceae bacterium]
MARLATVFEDYTAPGAADPNDPVDNTARALLGLQDLPDARRDRVGREHGHGQTCQGVDAILDGLDDCAPHMGTVQAALRVHGRTGVALVARRAPVWRSGGGVVG